jgi:hypothetical protein
MTKSLPNGTRRLLVRELRRAGNAVGRDFVDWAVRALADGYDTQSMRVLAGLDLDGIPSALEAVEKFRAAIHELGVPTASDIEHVHAYVSEVAQQIVDGELDPQEGAARITVEVLAPFDYPSGLMAWFDLGEGLHPHRHVPLEGDALNAAIREQARAWLGGAA